MDEYERMKEQRDAIEAKQKRKADEIIVRKCADIVMAAARDYNRLAARKDQEGYHRIATDLEEKAQICMAIHQQILREFEL